MKTDLTKYLGVLVQHTFNAKTAIKYISPNYRLKATRKHRGYGGKSYEIMVTIGKPNYAERAFIKDCVKAGEPFPVKKIQIIGEGI